MNILCTVRVLDAMLRSNAVMASVRSGAAFSKVPRKILGKLLILLILLLLLLHTAQFPIISLNRIDRSLVY